jgi:hypothetical protein
MSTQEILDRILVGPVHIFGNKNEQRVENIKLDYYMMNVMELQKESLPNGSQLCPINC